MVVYMARIVHQLRQERENAECTTADNNDHAKQVRHKRKFNASSPVMHGWDCRSSEDQDPFSLRQTPVATHEEKSSKGIEGKM